MNANRYTVGACVLGCSPSKQKTDVVGYNFWSFLYDPAGELYRTYGEGTGTTRTGATGVAQNPYWAQQLAAAQAPLAAQNLSRTQAQQQLQTALRTQQAANLAALQQQLAQMPKNIATAYAPPSPSTTSGLPPAAPSAGDGGAPSSQQTDGSSPDDGTTPTPSWVDPTMTVMGAMLNPDPQYLVVKVKNLPDVIAKQGGAIANLGYKLTPSTMANVVYGSMADEFKSSLLAKGVDADVTVTADPPKGKPPSGDLFAGMVLGAGTVGVGTLLWKYVIKGLFKR